MPARPPSVEDLRRACRDETPHSEQVARLAGELFDRTHPRLGLPSSEKATLLLACRLHDIGFAVAPGRHARESARLMRRKGVAGVARADLAAAAAAVLLHERSYRSALRHPFVRGLRDRKRALRLAAYLRVADALDHGHVQNASIRSVTLRGPRFLVTVHNDGYDGNVPWAEGKADLWRQVFPLDIGFRSAASAPGHPRFLGIVRRSDTAADAARRLLYLHYRLISESRRRALERDDPEDVHDLRVYTRRFRSALRFFRPLLDDRIPHNLAEDLRELGSALGPVRDAFVRFAFLEKVNRDERVRSDPAWSAYLQAQRAELGKHRRTLRAVLQRRQTEACLRRMVRFARAELPALARAGEPEPFRAFAVRRLRKQLRRTPLPRGLARLGPNELHELRCALRRSRYWAEFAEPALGPACRRLTRHLNRLTDALGTVHDMDVHIAELSDSRGPIARRLRKAARRERIAGLADARAVMRAMRRKGFRKRLKALLAGRRPARGKRAVSA